MNSGFGLVTHDVKTALGLLRGSLQELIFSATLVLEIILRWSGLTSCTVTHGVNSRS